MELFAGVIAVVRHDPGPRAPQPASRIVAPAGSPSSCTTTSNASTKKRGSADPGLSIAGYASSARPCDGPRKVSTGGTRGGQAPGGSGGGVPPNSEARSPTVDAGAHAAIPGIQTSVAGVTRPAAATSASCIIVYGPAGRPFAATSTAPGSAAARCVPRATTWRCPPPAARTRAPSRGPRRRPRRHRPGSLRRSGWSGRPGTPGTKRGLSTLVPHEHAKRARGPMEWSAGEGRG